MSISYNPASRNLTSLRSMNSYFPMTKQSLIVACVAVTLMFSAVSRAADPAPNDTSASPLAPLAFLTAHEWEAKLPDSKDGKNMSIRARFTWSESRQAIRISNQFVTDGKAAQYVEGLYAWNPEKKVLVFIYVGAEGNLSEGTVQLKDGLLVHEFREIETNGSSHDYVARVTPHGTESWDNEILARKGDALTPLVQVQYQPMQ